MPLQKSSPPSAGHGRTPSHSNFPLTFPQPAIHVPDSLLYGPSKPLPLSRLRKGSHILQRSTSTPASLHNRPAFFPFPTKPRPLPDPPETRMSREEELRQQRLNKVAQILGEDIPAMFAFSSGGAKPILNVHVFPDSPSEIGGTDEDQGVTTSKVKKRGSFSLPSLPNFTTVTSSLRPAGHIRRASREQFASRAVSPIPFERNTHKKPLPRVVPEDDFLPIASSTTLSRSESLLHSPIIFTDSTELPADETLSSTPSFPVSSFPPANGSEDQSACLLARAIIGGSGSSVELVSRASCSTGTIASSESLTSEGLHMHGDLDLDTGIEVGSAMVSEESVLLGASYRRQSTPESFGGTPASPGNFDSVSRSSSRSQSGTSSVISPHQLVVPRENSMFRVASRGDKVGGSWEGNKTGASATQSLPLDSILRLQRQNSASLEPPHSDKPPIGHLSQLTPGSQCQCRCHPDPCPASAFIHASPSRRLLPPPPGSKYYHNPWQSRSTNTGSYNAAMIQPVSPSSLSFPLQRMDSPFSSMSTATAVTSTSSDRSYYSYPSFQPLRPDTPFADVVPVAEEDEYEGELVHEDVEYEVPLKPFIPPGGGRRYMAPPGGERGYMSPPPKPATTKENKKKGKERAKGKSKEVKATKVPSVEVNIVTTAVQGNGPEQNQRMGRAMRTSRVSSVMTRKERRQGWSGEWNRGDMQDVISKLRSLR